MGAWLLDAGPIVAALNQRDACHALCLEVLGNQPTGPITTGAVVTEAMYLLDNRPGGAKRLASFLADMQAEIYDCFSMERLGASVAQMNKYSNLSMDFADATLVLAAEDLNIGDILTLDERGFRTFRFRGNRRFRLLIQDA